jgi:hypothetical protein
MNFHFNTDKRKQRKTGLLSGYYLHGFSSTFKFFVESLNYELGDITLVQKVLSVWF